MHKPIGAILFVAGTCIGSGMIALPMVLAKLGIISSLLLMMGIWFIMYYTSLVNLELNLQAGCGLSLGALGRRFSGKIAELIGGMSLKLLSYSLLAVFIYGESSILQKLITSKVFTHYSLSHIATVSAFIAILLLLLPIRFIDYFNRLLFIGLIAVVTLLLGGLVLTINWSELPLFSDQSNSLSVWMAIIPVVFTSFGFQVIFHTLSNYCNMDSKMLKKAFFWGSLIPAIVYMVWTCSILSVVYQDNPQFYQKMLQGTAEVGELIHALSGIAHSQSVELSVWSISLLAITTSILGVGVGLCDGLKGILSKKVPHPPIRNICASLMTILPAYLVVIYVPNAFITVLGFAGMILAVIAVLLPTYLFWQLKREELYYAELNRKYLLRCSIATALGVIICEICAM